MARVQNQLYKKWIQSHWREKTSETVSETNSYKPETITQIIMILIIICKDNCVDDSQPLSCLHLKVLSDLFSWLLHVGAGSAYMNIK